MTKYTASGMPAGNGLEPGNDAFVLKTKYYHNYYFSYWDHKFWGAKKRPNHLTKFQAIGDPNSNYIEIRNIWSGKACACSKKNLYWMKVYRGYHSFYAPNQWSVYYSSNNGTSGPDGNRINLMFRHRYGVYFSSSYAGYGECEDKIPTNTAKYYGWN